MEVVYQSINQSSLTSVSSSEDDFGDALSGHSKIHTHHPCDEITDPLNLNLIAVVAPSYIDLMYVFNFIYNKKSE